LTNTFWIVNCHDVLSSLAISASAADDANLPDCCKHGICPHHAAQHQNKSNNKDCDCRSSQEPGTMAAFMLAPAIAPMAVAVLPVPAPAASPSVQSNPIPATPDLLIFTPPPRA
jgi:hypothetical protein